ncbi:DUF4145 domain-containing protein [Aliarcobacter cryaerophilus]|uniref:DUF4145 domain-containing protein n=1 Tax=Aliarcobacter cryaerophilus TaxID=28198 RepID=UPI0021B51CFB|nr:DUF4145 domain-containing protein [Aliarcobacter cryaerophilus]MCT7545781.1 DUF4145 domain-containing protein [Aliarcobacter cryaerophilus]
MIFDFDKFSKDIASLQTQDDFSVYLESCFIELEEYLLNISNDEIQEIKFDIEDILYDLLDNNLIQNHNGKTINAFLILLAENFLQTSLIGAITIISDYLPSGATKLRLEAAKLYLRVNDITNDYFNRCDKILNLLEESSAVDEYNNHAIKSFLYFYNTVLIHCVRTDNPELAYTFINSLREKESSYQFLQDNKISALFQKDEKSDIKNILIKIENLLSSITYKKTTCHIENEKVQKEVGIYSQTLSQLSELSFEKIRNEANKYIQSIGDPEELFYRLQRGEAIIDDEKLLYKYLVSFGLKHKVKLYSAYDEIFEKIQKEKFDIVDWGCGQGTATMLLLDYAKKKNIILDIENITLIEPSQLALSRGLLHIDLFKQKDYKINSINSDLDCLKVEDLENKSNNKTLHLFSNILDIESFSLDNELFSKVAGTLKNDAIFICVSPNRNDKLNNRLELFYKHFDENFNTELISSRDSDISNSTRYEKIFEVKYTAIEIIEEKRDEIERIEKNYHLDVIKELDKYSNHVVPILNMKMLEDSILTDPEYAIFKIRKVAEVITSRIYSNYEANSPVVSFNDKIRYLSYEKKLFDKTITNYIHTLRTIGNRGVHEHNREVLKLKLDAHLMIIALISFLNELKDKKLLN